MLSNFLRYVGYSGFIYSVTQVKSIPNLNFLYETHKITGFIVQEKCFWGGDILSRKQVGFVNLFTNNPYPGFSQ